MFKNIFKKLYITSLSINLLLSLSLLINVVFNLTNSIELIGNVFKISAIVSLLLLIPVLNTVKNTN